MSELKKLLNNIYIAIDKTNWIQVQKECSQLQQIEMKSELIRAERKITKALKIPSRF